MLSTICCDCRGDLIASAEANMMERDWIDDPIAVREGTCRRCHESRHWWFFLVHLPTDPRDRKGRNVFR